EDEELKIEDTLEQAQLDDLDLSDFEESSEASEETSDEGILSFSDDELSELESLDLGETEDAAGEGMLSLDDLEEELDVDQGEVPATEDAGDTDEVSTKLDLARAYIDMGDSEGAQGILEEVVSEGSDEQKQEAQQLLDQLS
ncbi:MAG: FimV/HubP family polar landmark protein, partial [Candidatus Sedimenticola sp. 6PFRAG5]